MASPAGGKLLADYLIAGRKPPQLAPFASSRFKENKAIHESSLVVLIPEEVGQSATRAVAT
jgi:hypothetical protein